MKKSIIISSLLFVFTNIFGMTTYYEEEHQISQSTYKPPNQHKENTSTHLQFFNNSIDTNTEIQQRYLPEPVPQVQNNSPHQSDRNTSYSSKKHKKTKKKPFGCSIQQIDQAIYDYVEHPEISIKTIAQKVGISPQTIYKWTNTLNKALQDLRLSPDTPLSEIANKYNFSSSILRYWDNRLKKNPELIISRAIKAPSAENWNNLTNEQKNIFKTTMLTKKFPNDEQLLSIRGTDNNWLNTWFTKVLFALTLTPEQIQTKYNKYSQSILFCINAWKDLAQERASMKTNQERQILVQDLETPHDKKIDKVIRDYINSPQTLIKDIAEQHNISQKHILRTVRRLNCATTKYLKYPNMSIEALALKNKLPAATLRYWINQNQESDQFRLTRQNLQKKQIRTAIKTYIEHPDLTTDKIAKTFGIKEHTINQKIQKLNQALLDYKDSPSTHLNKIAKKHHMSLYMLNYWIDIVKKTGEQTIPLRKKPILPVSSLEETQINKVIFEYAYNPQITIKDLFQKSGISNTKIRNLIGRINKALKFYRDNPNISISQARAVS